MSNMKYLSVAAINNVKSNSKTVWENIKANITIDSVFDFLSGDYWIESEYDFDFNFSMDGYARPEDSDYDNCVRLYETLKDIPLNILFSEQFLSGFLFTYGYEYFRWRWIDAVKDSPDSLKHIFFWDGPRRSIAVNAIGRLLMRAFRLVDESLGESKYDLLKLAFENSGCFAIDYYTYADNEVVYRSFVNAYCQLKNEGYKINTSVTRTILKHLSMIQGMNIGENLNEYEIEERIVSYARTTIHSFPMGD